MLKIQFHFAKSLLCFFGVLLVLPISAKAQTEPPQFMTVDGRLYDSTTPEDPLLDNSVLMRIQVLNPAKTCILYEEEQTVSTLSSNGYFNVRVGSPTSGAESLKRTTNDSGNSMVSVFQNQSASITGRTSGGGACSYTPTAGDTRYFRYIVTPSSTGVTSTLSPDMQIDSVPQSLVAETLQGMSPDDFVQINSDVTQAKANALFGGSYTTLTGLLAGTSSLYLRNTTNGTVLPSRATDPLTPAAGQIWYDSDDNVLRYFDGTVVQTLSSGSADPTKLPLAGGTMAGAIDMATNDITDIGHMTQAPQRTFRFGVYTTAQQTSLIATPLVAGHEGTVWYNTTTNKLMFWDGSAEYAVSPVDSVFGRTGAVVAVAGDYTATQITNTAAGNIAATDAQAAINELDTEKVAKAGDSMSGALTMSAQNQIRFADSAGGEYAAIQAPATIGANYVLTLPTSAGSANQVLTTDGTGVLSWTSLAAVGETNTASNQGVGGVGLYDAKSGVDLQFRNINAASNKVSVALDAGNKEVDINVNEANLDSAVIPNTAAGNIAATNVQAAINELDTEKVATTRAINTAAGSGLTGGGDLSADRSLSVNINGTTAETTVAGADEILIYDASASALRKMTRTNFVLSESEVDAFVANNGYLTAEADTLATVTGRGASTATNITMNTQAQTRYADAAGGEYAAIQAPATIGANYVLTLPDTAGSASQVLTTDGTGVLSWTSLAAVGETNTASNQGVGGVGLYDAKSGVDLQFRNINAASNKVSVALDAGNKEVDINVNETNLDSAVIPNTAAGNIAATNVQAAINELDTEKVAKSGDTMTGRLNMGPSGVAATNGGSIAFTELAANGTAQVGFRAPDDVTTGVIWALPAADGSAGQVLQTSGTGVLSWIAIPSAPVSSVFGRTGAVVAATSDYDANQIDNTAAGNIAATDVQAAINELDTEKVATTRAINTAAGSGLSGGGDLSADRSLSVNINGTTAETTVAGADEILIYDASASALRKMTRTNFVLSEAEVDAMVSNNGYLTAEADTLATVTGRGASTATNITMSTQAQTRYADAAGGEYAAIQAPTTISANYVLTLPTSAGSASQVLTTDGTGVLSWTSLAAVGETNTASNQGIGGVGLYDAKSGVDLQFRNINAASNKVSVALDAGNKEVDINVNEANLDSAVIPNTAAGNVASTNVQAAINELDTEKVAKSGDTMTGALNIDNEQELRLSEADGSGANYVAIKALTTLGANYTLTLPPDDGVSGQYLQTDGNGVLTWVTPAGVGETNTASNQGVGGVGVFKQKTTFDLEFRNINAASNKISVALDAGNNEIDINVSEANLDTAVIPNTAAGTISATNTQAAINELDTEKVATTRAINTAAGSGLTGGGDLSADRSLSVNINGTTAETAVAGADEILIYDASASALRKMTRTNFVLSESEVDAMVGNNGYLTAEADTLASVTGRGASTATNITMNTQAQTRYTDAAGGEYAAIQAPATIGANYVLTLPETAGANGQVLSTNGSGVLSWTNTTMTPSGADKQIQFNDAGSLGAEATLQFNKTTKTLSVGDVGNEWTADLTTNGVWGQLYSQNLYVTGNNVIEFRTSGGTQMRLSNSGNLGIGLGGSDTSSRLGVAGGAAIGSYAGGSAPTNGLIVSGQVGIGTDTPGTLLDVAGSITSRPHGTAAGETGKLILRELSASGTNSVIVRSPDTLSADYILTLPVNDGDAGQYLQTDGNGVLSWVTPAGVGETNTASNQGVGGVGVFDAKATFDLQFRNINAASNKISVALDAGNKEIDINVNEANLSTASIPNTAAGNIAATNTQAAINELDTEKVATTRAINTAAGSGLAGGGDLSADRSLSVNINGTTAETSVAGADEILIYDASATALRKMSRTNFVLSESEVDTMVSNNGFLSSESDTLATVTGRGASTSTDIVMNAQGDIRFADSDSSNYIAVQSPATVGSNYTLTLPATSGAANQVLTTDGTGVLSWTTPASGVVADSLNFTDFADAMTLDANTDIAVTGTNVLSVTNSGTGDSFRVNDAAGDTSPFVIDAAGLVGIGTTGPSYPVDIVYSGADFTGGGVLNIDTSGSSISTAPAFMVRVPATGLRKGFQIVKGADASAFASFEFSVGGAGKPGFEFGPGASTARDTNVYRDAANILKTDDTLVVGSSFRQLAGDSYFTGNVGIGTTIPSTLLDVTGAITSRPHGTATGETGKLIMRELAAGGTETATIRAPDAITTSYALTLPTSSGAANQVLTTDGSGVLSWTTPSGGGGGALSGLTAATATNTIANANYAQTWNWDTLSTQTAMSMGTTSGTTGTLLNLTNSYNNASSTGNVLKVNATGASNAAVPLMITNAGTGYSFRVNDDGTDTDSTAFIIGADGNVGIGTAPVGWAALRVDGWVSTNGIYMIGGNGVVGASGTDVRLASDSGWTSASLSPGGSEVLTALASGNVGIGTTAPGTLLDVAGAITSRPHGTATGETGKIIMRELAAGGTETATIRAPDAITTSYSLTLPTSAGAANQVLTTNGSGVLSWTTPSGGVAADSLNFTDFADAMTLDASTDIAVSGTNVLSITNSGTGDSFVVNDQASDTTPFVIDAAGNVGIGTTSAGTPLEVTSPSTASVVDILTLHNPSGASWSGSSIVFEGNSGQAMGRIVSQNDGATTHANMEFKTRSSGSEISALKIRHDGFLYVGSDIGSSEDGMIHVGYKTSTGNAVADSLTLLHYDDNSAASSGIGNRLKFVTETTTNNTYRMSAAIDSVMDDATDNSKDGSLRFLTMGPNSASGVTSPTEKLRIDSSGNIGIGTTTPTIAAVGTVLHLHDATASEQSLMHFTNATTGATSTDGSYIGVDSTDKLVIAQGENSDIQFWTFGSERFRVTGAGSVGIGTTVPGTLLDVAGAITSRPSGTGTGQTGQIIMRELASGGTNTFAIRAPDALSADRNWTLPDSNGSSGQVLQTNGSGVLSWVTVGGGGSLDSLSDAMTDATAESIYIGSGAGTGAASTYQYNLALGYSALSSMNNASADRNTAIGWSALSSLNSGANNTALGSEALQAVDSGGSNVGVGREAMGRLTSGSNNTSVGTTTLFEITSHSDNTALGAGAGVFLDGNSNVMIGRLAMESGGAYAGDADNNIAVGTLSLAGITSGDNNVSIGKESFLSVTTASNNIGVGNYSGGTLTTGNNNILIGYGIDVASAGTSNFMSLGNIIFATGVDGTGTTVSSGKVGVGMTAPTARLTIGDAAAVDGGIIASGYGTVGTDGDVLSVTGAGRRMMWYPRKGAFRAGGVDSDQWDDANIGNYSVAMGNNAKALGNYGIALGNASAEGISSVAIGNWVSVFGLDAAAIGNNIISYGNYNASFGNQLSNQASSGGLALGTGVQVGSGFGYNNDGNYSVAIGAGNPAGARPMVTGDSSVGIFMGDQSGLDLSADNTMAIIGGNVGIGSLSPTTKLVVDGGVTISPATTINLTADNQLVTVGNESYLRLSSNNATSTNRTFCLTAGATGQVLIIELTAQAAELIDGAQACAGSPAAVNLSATWTAGADDTIQLIYNGSRWLQISTANN